MGQGEPAVSKRSWPSALLCAALLAVLSSAYAAGEDATPAKPRSMQEILDASRPSDWRTPDAKNLVYLGDAIQRHAPELDLEAELGETVVSILSRVARS